MKYMLYRIKENIEELKNEVKKKIKIGKTESNKKYISFILRKKERK